MKKNSKQYTPKQCRTCSHWVDNTSEFCSPSTSKICIYDLLRPCDPRYRKHNARKRPCAVLAITPVSHGFDMNQCKPNDKLLTVSGLIVSYVSKIIDAEPEPNTNHIIMYSGGAYGTRTNLGYMSYSGVGPGVYDIVGFAPTETTNETTTETTNETTID